jgi:hypothetical protein
MVLTESSMKERDFAEMEVRRAAGDAGDACGSADAAKFHFDRGEFAVAATWLKLAREQAEKARATATQAEWRLLRMIANEKDSNAEGQP